MLGTLTTSVSQSQGLGNGRQYSLGYSYYSRRFGITAQRIERTEDYADLSLVSTLEEGGALSQLTKRSDQLTLSVSPERLGSFGIGYFANEEHDGTRTRLINLSWSRSLKGSSSLYVSFNRQIGESGYSAQAQLVIPFDLLSTVAVGVERNSNGEQRARVNYSHSPPARAESAGTWATRVVRRSTVRRTLPGVPPRRSCRPVPIATAVSPPTGVASVARW